MRSAAREHRLNLRSGVWAQVPSVNSTQCVSAESKSPLPPPPSSKLHRHHAFSPPHTTAAPGAGPAAAHRHATLLCARRSTARWHLGTRKQTSRVLGETRSKSPTLTKSPRNSRVSRSPRHRIMSASPSRTARPRSASSTISRSTQRTSRSSSSGRRHAAWTAERPFARRTRAARSTT